MEEANNNWTRGLTGIQKSNLYLIEKSFIGLTENEKRDRNELLMLRKDYNEKKNVNVKRRQKIQDLVDNVESIVNKKGNSVLLKSKCYWRLGRELIKKGRRNMGLQYLNLAIDLKGDMLGRSHPQVMTQLCYYNKVC